MIITEFHTKIIRAYELGFVVEFIPCKMGLLEIRMYPKGNEKGRSCQLISLAEVIQNPYDLMGYKIEEMIEEVKELNS